MVTEETAPGRMAWGTLHLWQVQPRDFAGMQGSLVKLLSDGEVARAARYKLPEPRLQFIIGRAVLRWILSCYVGEAAGRLELSEGEHGKPYLVARASAGARARTRGGTGGARCDTGPSGAVASAARGDAAACRDVQFNLAHTDDLMLCLVGCGRAVGVDVEIERTIVGDNRLASLLFAVDQRRAFDALPEAARVKALLSTWTTMEALGKATGRGLAGALKHFRLELDPDTGSPTPEQVCSSALDHYAVRALDLPAGYVGAMAVEVMGGGNVHACPDVPVPETHFVDPHDVLAACNE